MKPATSSCSLLMLILAMGAAPGQASQSPSTPAFPLKVSENRRHLVDQAGRPFFILGDTPWFIQKLKLEEARMLMDDRLAKGYNTLFLELLDDSRIPSRDGYGNVAFDGEKDITKPVEAYWRYAEQIMEETEKRGFFVIMSELWYGAGEGLWMHHVTPDRAKSYGAYIGQRFARFKNLMWMHAGDRNPDQNLAECTRALARAMAAAAPHHLHTVHNAHEFASARFHHEDPWLDVNLGYTYGAAYLHIIPEYQRANPIRPVILGETGYEAEPNAIELLPDAREGDLWNPYRIRRNAWWSVLSGASGYCAGSRLWRWESNWRETMQVRSIVEAPNILRLMNRLPWWKLVPDLKHEFITGGFGEWKQANYATAALAEDGSCGAVYLPSPRTVTVNLSKLKGPAQAHWFDPATSAWTSAEGVPSQGNREFTPPGLNAAGEPDWVLVLQTESAGTASAPKPGPPLLSSEYRVFANDAPVFVYDTPIATLAQFTLTNRAELRVECQRDIKWADVRPLRWGIRPKIGGNSLQFTLTQPCKLSLELNGEFSRRPLFLFADAPERNPPQSEDKNLRFFPAGQHEAGAIEMKSGETVYLAAGARVRGWIHAQGATNLRICGPGILLGTGTTNMPGRRRSRSVHLQNCTNVVVEGVTLVDSPTWQVVPIGCENVTVRNVKIISDNGGDDGIDIVSSRKVRIADCFIRTKDDCIAIKSFAGPTNEVGTCEVDVSNSVFWNAAWGNALEIGFELRATEVRDIVFRNCDVIHVEDGAVFSIHNGDFATVRNARFEDIRVEDARQKLFDLAIFLTQYSLDRPADPQERQRRYLNGAWDGVLSVSPTQQAEHAPHRGQIRDVVFKDIAVVDGQFPFSVISGFDAGHLVQNVTFDNCTVHGRKIRDAEKGKFFIEHATNIRFK